MHWFTVNTCQVSLYRQLSLSRRYVIESDRFHWLASIWWDQRHRVCSQSQSKRRIGRFLRRRTYVCVIHTHTRKRRLLRRWTYAHTFSRYVSIKIEITRCLAWESMSGMYKAGLSISDSWPRGVSASRRGPTTQRKRKSWLDSFFLPSIFARFSSRDLRRDPSHM